MLEIWKKPSIWFGLTGVLTLGMGILFAPGCTTEDDDDSPAGDDDTMTGDDDTQAGDDDTEAGDDDTADGDDDTAIADTVMVTFVVDTNTMADGANKLAEVLDGENCFIVGSMNGWEPQSMDYAMTEDTETEGLFSITLELTVGETIEYKYTKTSDDPANGWNNGMKDYEAVDTMACDSPTWNNTTAETADFTGALWEIPNLSLTVPSEDTTLETYTVDAFRNYAEGFGYPSCD